MVIGIYGTGGTGKDVYDVVVRQKHYEKIIFIDDTKEIGYFRNNELYPFEKIPKSYNPQNMKIIIAVGEPMLRKKLYDRVKEKGYILTNVIHEDTDISEYANVGEGLIAFKGVIIGADAKLGENILLEPYVVMGHDVCVKRHTVLSCQVLVGGHAQIGEAVYIALASAIKDRVQIGNETIIGVGSRVVKDLPENIIAVGYPARVVKKNESIQIFGK